MMMDVSHCLAMPLAAGNKKKSRKIVTVGILGGRGANNWVVQSIIMCTIGHIIGIWIALLLIAEQRSSTPFFIGKCIALSLLKWKKSRGPNCFCFLKQLFSTSPKSNSTIL